MTKNIHIDGIIQQNWGELISELSDAGDVCIYINSFGGSVTEGFAVADAIRRHSATNNVEIIGTGFIASIATIILLSGKPGMRKMAENAFMMIHRPTVYDGGNADDMRRMASVLDSMENKLIDVYVAAIRSNNKLVNGSEEETRAQVKAWVDAETWFSAQEAFDAGLIDAISEAQYFDVATAQNSAKLQSLPEKVKQAMNMNITPEDKTLFQKFLAFLGFSPKAECSPEEKPEPEAAAKAEIENQQQSEEMTEEQMIEALKAKGYTVEVEKEETEMTEEEMMAALEAKGMKVKKMEAAAENNAATELQRLKEENARLLQEKRKPVATATTEPKPEEGKTRKERALNAFVNSHKQTLEGVAKGIFNKMNGID